MSMRISLVLSAVLVLAPALAGEAAAQKLSLRIEQGLVTLDAEDVSVEEVLARWMRTTGLSVISKGGEGSDLRVSLRLEGVTEREALTAVLRDLSGYIIGERRDPATGIVTVDRLMILSLSAGHADTQVDAPLRRVPAPDLAPMDTDDTYPVVEATPGPVDETPRELAPVPLPGEDWGSTGEP
jgi:hypothetical protein